MEDQYPIQPEETNLYDEPSDDDLKQIEDELSDLLFRCDIQHSYLIYF